MPQRTSRCRREDIAAASFQGRPNDLVVALERHAHPAGILFPAPCRVLDVREEERHGARWSRPLTTHHYRIARVAEMRRPNLARLDPLMS